MFILIVGCGRVGSSVARAMLGEGHEVSCLDEDPESHARLAGGVDKGWEDLGGQFTVGAGLETDALVAAGIEKADAFIASTDGDNTNIVIAQIAQKRYEVPTVIARVLESSAAPSAPRCSRSNSRANWRRKWTRTRPPRSSASTSPTSTRSSSRARTEASSKATSGPWSRSSPATCWSTRGGAVTTC